VGKGKKGGKGARERGEARKKGRDGREKGRGRKGAGRGVLAIPILFCFRCRWPVMVRVIR